MVRNCEKDGLFTFYKHNRLQLTYKTIQENDPKNDHMQAKNTICMIIISVLMYQLLHVLMLLFLIAKCKQIWQLLRKFWNKGLKNEDPNKLYTFRSLSFYKEKNSSNAKNAYLPTTKHLELFGRNFFVLTKKIVFTSKGFYLSGIHAR